MAYRNYSTAVGKIVDQNGQGDFTTIQAAINASVANDLIFVRPGGYSESLSLPNHKVSFVAWYEGMRGITPNTAITGTITDHASGSSAVFSNFFISNPAGSFVNLSSASGSTILFKDCDLSNTSAASIGMLMSGNVSSQLLLYDCTGNQGNAGHAYWFITTGFLSLRNTTINNDAGSTVLNVVGGNFGLVDSEVDFGITYAGPNTAGIRNSYINTFAINTIGLTTTTSGGLIMEYSSFNCGTASCVSIGTGTTVDVINCDLNSSNTNVLTGAGTLNYGGIVFTGSSSGHNVSTENPYATLN